MIKLREVPQVLRYGSWRKSSYSNGSGGNNCVEVGLQTDGGAVLVRNSKRRAGAAVAFTREEWEAFLDGVRDGEFDLPPDVRNVT